MFKLFANRSALTAASFIAVASVLHPAAAQDRGPYADQLSATAGLAPSTSGAAPRVDRESNSQAGTPARPTLPEMQITDYSVVFPQVNGEETEQRPPSPIKP